MPAEELSGLRRSYSQIVWHWTMFGIVLLTIPAFYLQLAATDPRLQSFGSILYFAVAVLFGLRLVWLLRSAPSMGHFVGHYWIDVLISAGAAISAAAAHGVWNVAEWTLRLLYFIPIVTYMILSLRDLFSPTRITHVAGLAVVSLGLAGAGFYLLEPTVGSYADGLWLAFASGATVGYGDLVPTTAASRIFAAFVVLIGYALMSLLTASLAAIFIGEDEKLLRREMHHDIKQLREEVAALRAELRGHPVSFGRHKPGEPETRQGKP